jgi:flagellin
VQGLGGAATVDGTIELQVINTGVSIAVQETFIESATGTVCVSSTLYGPGIPPGHGGMKGLPGAQIPGVGGANSGGFDNVAITLGAFRTVDVGSTTYIKISQNVAALTSPDDPAFNVQSAADEGDIVQIGIAATNTQTLRVSNINLAISAASNPSLGAEDSIGQVDIALGLLTSEQVKLGAVVVRLNFDEDDDNTAALNLQASESNIRDLNVGAATTEFTKLQVLVQTGTAVLAQSFADAKSVLALFR